jgi:hypothetical protein
MSSEAASVSVRSNALVVLGDLCVRYTALVERHVPAMAARLQVLLATYTVTSTACMSCVQQQLCAVSLSTQYVS